MILVRGQETLKMLDQFTAKYDAMIAEAKEKFKFEEGKIVHPSQLERTLLLEGKITCTAISIGHVTDNTVNAHVKYSTYILFLICMCAYKTECFISWSVGGFLVSDLTPDLFWAQE